MLSLARRSSIYTQLTMNIILCFELTKELRYVGFLGQHNGTWVIGGMLWTLLKKHAIFQIHSCVRAGIVLCG